MRSASPYCRLLSNSIKSTEQEITGDILLRLDTNTLKTEIGVTALGKRCGVASSTTDLRQSSISSSSNSSITKTSLPPSSFAMPPLARSTCLPEDCITVNVTFSSLTSWTIILRVAFQLISCLTCLWVVLDACQWDGFEIPFTIDGDVPMSFETSPSFSHRHSSGNRAVSHDFSLLFSGLFVDITYLTFELSRAPNATQHPLSSGTTSLPLFSAGPLDSHLPCIIDSYLLLSLGRSTFDFLLEYQLPFFRPIRA